MKTHGQHKAMPLFDRLALEPPHNGVPTSMAAAESIREVAGTQRRRILEALLENNAGMTDEEIQDVTGINPSAERPRRGELVQMGRVRDTGQTKPTKSGRQAIVWEAIR